MTEIAASIFKKYDIRGRATGEGAPLNKEAAFAIGQAIGTHLQRIRYVQRVVVGRDNRSSSFDLQEALMNGLKRSGMRVIDIGLVSTPLVYWHAVQEGNVGGVMVTGSHLGPDQNGFKISVGAENLWDVQIQQLRQIIERNDFSYGSGEISSNLSAYSDYVRDLTQRIQISRPLKVVIDPGNGTGGLFAPRLFKLWGMETTGIYIEPDGSFPNHVPNPQEAENMRDLGAKVVEMGADLGIAFDGDADRMGVVDERGRMITADRVLALLAQDMLKRRPGALVIGDVLCSQALFDTIERSNGEAMMAASGHSIVKDMMRENHALLGGEMSGHIFLGEDYFGFDDGYFAAGRFMQLVAAADQPVSALDAALPHYYSTPEYRPHCPDEDKAHIIGYVHERMLERGYPVVDVDGVRVQFERGWGILRASNTEPVLSLRFEGQTEGDALTYRNLFAADLAVFPQVAKFI